MFHRSIVDFRGGKLEDVHSSTYETYLVQWCSIDQLPIRGGGGVNLRMCIILYVKLVGVVKFHRSIVN